MAKTNTQYVCQSCGRITPRYMGKCPQCGEFGTMVEQLVAAAPKTAAAKRRAATIAAASVPQRLPEITADVALCHRCEDAVAQLDAVS